MNLKQYCFYSTDKAVTLFNISMRETQLNFNKMSTKIAQKINHNSLEKPNYSDRFRCLQLISAARKNSNHLHIVSLTNWRNLTFFMFEMNRFDLTSKSMVSRSVQILSCNIKTQKCSLLICLQYPFARISFAKQKFEYNLQLKLIKDDTSRYCWVINP